MKISGTMDYDFSPKEVAEIIVEEFNNNEQAELLYYIFGTMFHKDSLVQYDWISTEFNDLDKSDHESIVNHLNELTSRIRGVYIDRLKEDIPNPMKNEIKNNEPKGDAYWIEDNSQVWFTPGGDPVWKCGHCGGGRHVYGIENCNNPKHICPECGYEMLYDWGKKYGT